MNYFNYLHNIESKQLFDALEGEQPQVIAIVLAHAETALASETLELFSKSLQVDISIRMAELEEIPEVLLQSISDTLEKKIAPKSVKVGGVKAVAEMLKHLK